MKKVLCVISVICMPALLTACGNKTPEEPAAGF